jgi:CRP-like cAMP-binding protein
MQTVAQALYTTGAYTPADTLLFEREVKTRHIAKNEILLQPGEVAKSIYFNQKGAIYQYTLPSATTQNIIELHVENEWLLNQASLAKQAPSDSYIAAYTESIVLELSIASIHFLIGCSQAFFQLNTILAQPASKTHIFDHALTPLQKYQYVIETKPQILQAFPLKMIASYLKITPETLSRVREKIAKGNSIS